MKAFVCERCNRLEKGLPHCVLHIVAKFGYDLQVTDIDNLIGLCKKCCFDSLYLWIQQK